jgi:hypothetical protein
MLYPDAARYETDSQWGFFRSHRFLLADGLKSVRLYATIHSITKLYLICLLRPA